MQPAAAPSPLCSSMELAGVYISSPSVQEKQPATQCIPCMCKEVCCPACAEAVHDSAGGLSLAALKGLPHPFTLYMHSCNRFARTLTPASQTFGWALHTYSMQVWPCQLTWYKLCRSSVRSSRPLHDLSTGCYNIMDLQHYNKHIRQSRARTSTPESFSPCSDTFSQV